MPEDDYHRLTLLPALDPLDHRQPAAQGRDHRGRAARRAGGARDVRAGRSACGCATTGRRRAAPAISARRITCAARSGAVVRHLGDFANPEDLAFARPGGDAAAVSRALRRSTRSGTKARDGDEVLVELFGHWLERRHEACSKPTANACCAAVRGPAGARRASPRRRRSPSASPSPTPPPRRRARAWWRRPGSIRPIRALMLADGTAAAEALGIPMRGVPPLGVLENTPDLHHLVVCTLCSCYPRAVLGYPPFWYKSAAYRARAVRDPRGAARRVRHRAARERARAGGGQHRRLSLDGAAAAPGRHRGLGRGAAGRRSCARAT